MSDEEESLTEVYAAIGMLAVFSIVGVIGNALVLYVFSNFKQKLTSTIFILALAGTDFFTCLITIPYTIAVESLEYKLYYNSVCQFYHFLITTTIPFSAFVMVAIAVDRYLCICHPFRHAMTIRRAKYIVSFLCVFAVILGILCCLNFHVAPVPAPPLTSMNESMNMAFDLNATSEPIEINFTVYPNSSAEAISNETIGDLFCQPKNIKNKFFLVYQKIYSSFFAICCVIVMILYAIIYRSVLARRRQRLQVVTNKCCGFWADIPSESSSEQTEISTLNNETSAVELKEMELKDKAVQKNGTNATTTNEKDNILRPGSVSRVKLEKMKMANIKTAFMLSIVTLVFIVAFLPSWLVALRVFDMNVVVFYMYFSYNVANPVIYAFMNNQFRTQLKVLFHCHS